MMRVNFRQKRREKILIFAMVVSLIYFLFLQRIQTQNLNNVINSKPQIFKFLPLQGKPTTYKTNKRESLFKIAKEFGTTYPHIQRANLYFKHYVSSGKNLIIPTFRIIPKKIEEGIVLNIPEFTIYYFKGGRLIKTFPISCGSPSMPTPVGSFKITSRLLNPTWRPPEWAGLEKPVPPGPHNPLGDYWMGLSIRGYGIHSTNSPRSIGKAVSHGCIRMYPWHARELFHLVKVGTPVEIIYQPIKLGQDKGIIYIEVHKDIYHQGTNRLKKVKKLLEKKQIKEGVDEDKLKIILNEKRGIPVPLVGEEIKILVEGKEISLNLAPVIKDKRTFLDIEKLGKILNANLNWINEKEVLITSFQGNTIEMDIKERRIIYNGQLIAEKIPVLNILGRRLVPLRFFAQLLDAKVSFSSAEKTIYLNL